MDARSKRSRRSTASTSLKYLLTGSKAFGLTIPQAGRLRRLVTRGTPPTSSLTSWPSRRTRTTPSSPSEAPTSRSSRAQLAPRTATTSRTTGATSRPAATQVEHVKVLAAPASALERKRSPTCTCLPPTATFTPPRCPTTATRRPRDLEGPAVRLVLSVNSARPPTSGRPHARRTLRDRHGLRERSLSAVSKNHNVLVESTAAAEKVVNAWSIPAELTDVPRPREDGRRSAVSSTRNRIVPARKVILASVNNLIRPAPCREPARFFLPRTICASHHSVNASRRSLHGAETFAIKKTSGEHLRIDFANIRLPRFAH